MRELPAPPRRAARSLAQPRSARIESAVGCSVTTGFGASCGITPWMREPDVAPDDSRGPPPGILHRPDPRWVGVIWSSGVRGPREHGAIPDGCGSGTLPVRGSLPLLPLPGPVSALGATSL